MVAETTAARTGQAARYICTAARARPCGPTPQTYVPRGRRPRRADPGGPVRRQPALFVLGHPEDLRWDASSAPLLRRDGEPAPRRFHRAGQPGGPAQSLSPALRAAGERTPRAGGWAAPDQWMRGRAPP